MLFLKYIIKSLITHEAPSQSPGVRIPPFDNHWYRQWMNGGKMKSLIHVALSFITFVLSPMFYCSYKSSHITLCKGIAPLCSFHSGNMNEYVPFSPSAASHQLVLQYSIYRIFHLQEVPIYLRLQQQCLKFMKASQGEKG